LDGNDMSYDMKSDRFSALKDLTNKIRSARMKGEILDKENLPQVLSNGEILAGLISNASDNEMEF